MHHHASSDTRINRRSHVAPNSRGSPEKGGSEPAAVGGRTGARLRGGGLGGRVFQGTWPRWGGCPGRCRQSSHAYTPLLRHSWALSSRPSTLLPTSLPCTRQAPSTLPAGRASEVPGTPGTRTGAALSRGPGPDGRETGRRRVRSQGVEGSCAREGSGHTKAGAQGKEPRLRKEKCHLAVHRFLGRIRGVAR